MVTVKVGFIRRNHAIGLAELVIIFQFPVTIIVCAGSTLLVTNGALSVAVGFHAIHGSRIGACVVHSVAGTHELIGRRGWMVETNGVLYASSSTTTIS